MKFFQNKINYFFNIVVAILFIGIVSISALPGLEEYMSDSDVTNTINYDLEKKKQGNPLSEKDMLEEISEICFGKRTTINYCEDFYSVLSNEFLVDGLPNCSCDVYIPPPKQREPFIASQLIG